MNNCKKCQVKNTINFLDKQRITMCEMDHTINYLTKKLRNVQIENDLLKNIINKNTDIILN